MRLSELVTSTKLLKQMLVAFDANTSILKFAVSMIVAVELSETKVSRNGYLLAAGIVNPKSLWSILNTVTSHKSAIVIPMLSMET
jgi:hypothetical protein